MLLMNIFSVRLVALLNDISARDDRQQPPRHDAGDGQADQRREDEQPVRGGVEQLAESGHLPEPAGEQPV